VQRYVITDEKLRESQNAVDLFLTAFRMAGYGLINDDRQAKQKYQKADRPDRHERYRGSQLLPSGYGPAMLKRSF